MKTLLDPRHQKREKIIQELFAWQEQNQIKTDNIAEKVVDRIDWDEKTKHIITSSAEIDEVIISCAPEWEINKINQVDLAILRLAIFELIFEANEPSKAIIDEAVELAKQYGTESSPRFVNGALGKATLHPKRILKLISNHLGTDHENLLPETLLSELNATDLEVSDLMIFLEKELQLTLPPKTSFTTVGDIMSFVEDSVD